MPKTATAAAVAAAAAATAAAAAAAAAFSARASSQQKNNNMNGATMPTHRRAKTRRAHVLLWRASFSRTRNLIRRRCTLDLSRARARGGDDDGGGWVGAVVIVSECSLAAAE